MHNAPLNWHAVCGVEDIDEEDLIDFEHNGKPYAVYHTRSGFYSTDAICTHEYANLCSGMVLGEIVECPRHQGRFHIPTGKAKGAPVVGICAPTRPRSKVVRFTSACPNEKTTGQGGAQSL
jgi:3-phenylpropionate/trans-cinnamate dioxygenase ferredoxin subunit